MKKLTLKYLSMLFVLAICFTSCSDDDPADVNLSEDRLASLYFSSGSGNVFVTEDDGSAVAKIPVAASYIYSTDRAIAVTVDSDKSTVDPADYSIVDASLKIPANSVEGFIEININFNNGTPLEEENLIVLDLSAIDPNLLPLVDVSNARLNYELTVVQVNCPVVLSAPLAGNWTATSNGTNADNQQGGVAVDYEYAVTIIDNGDGTLNFSDALGGLYRYWYEAPYGYNRDTPRDLNFNICGEMSGTFDTFFNNDVVTYTGSYDSTTDEITVTWSNVFGDQATAVYSR
ncbi:hypothetical protein [Aureivirga marina]|uniref:hypothetical protein n=1 Tax=Aureivirga marina TaxID=1182451 RepID=UPI0018C98578|nr:hypothetical protein [Aureivirga marina]